MRGCWVCATTTMARQVRIHLVFPFWSGLAWPGASCPRSVAAIEETAIGGRCHDKILKQNRTCFKKTKTSLRHMPPAAHQRRPICKPYANHMQTICKPYANPYANPLIASGSCPQLKSIDIFFFFFVLYFFLGRVFCDSHRKRGLHMGLHMVCIWFAYGLHMVCIWGRSGGSPSRPKPSFLNYLPGSCAWSLASSL